MNNQQVSNQKHLTFFRATLYGALGVLAISVFINIMLILFIDFNDIYQAARFFQIIGTTWQIFWFGALSLIFAKLYDKTNSALSKSVDILGVVICALLLIIGIGLSIDLIGTSRSVSAVQDVLNILLYSAMFIGVQGVLKQPNNAVKIEHTVMSAILGLLDVFAITLTLINISTNSSVMPRFYVILIILAITNAIATAILNTLHKNPQTQIQPQVQNPTTLAPQTSQPASVTNPTPPIAKESSSKPKTKQNSKTSEKSSNKTSDK